MRLANIDGRAALVFVDGADADGTSARALDVERTSQGQFGSDPQALFADWTAFGEWASSVEPGGTAIDRARLGAPVPRPRQVFAIGINYAEHAAEAGYPAGSLPITFTKFPSSLTGPDAQVELPPGSVDWEVELVVVIARSALNVSREDAWAHVAGLTIGQDLSERETQNAGAKPQYSLAKSHTGFGPMGPWLVSTDEFADPGDLAISSTVSGEPMQSSRTSKMIYSVPDLIFELSGVCELYPGDVIFSGTPAGVGNARTPKRFLGPADVLRSEIEGIGYIENTFRVR
ncbi:MAG TPA: fumarylacetoacetate hydrolase family protein [Galbitalea sp.]|jgi:2-keto-4-pentenoate hydratase/2-oxohepta-3-ene-1,7-dioic acid hydratase in catechol pathway|nr:fumarylacetoacetate hydrolase family protein [Galbitalea sp.]